MKSLCHGQEVLHKKNEDGTRVWCECPACGEKCIQVFDKFAPKEI